MIFLRLLSILFSIDYRSTNRQHMNYKIKKSQGNIQDRMRLTSSLTLH